MHAEGERIAQAEGPDGAVVAGGGVVKRIIRGDGAVPVDPQHLAEAVGERLRVRGDGVLADGDVELPVFAEVNRAAVVVRRGEGLEIHQYDLAAGQGDVAVRGEAADAVVDGARGGRVVDVDVLIAEKVGIEGDAEEAALAGGVDGDGDERRGQQRVVLHDAQGATLLADED